MRVTFPDNGKAMTATANSTFKTEIICLIVFHITFHEKTALAADTARPDSGHVDIFASFQDCFAGVGESNIESRLHSAN